MKRIIPFFASAVLACGYSTDALAQDTSVKVLPRVERIDGNRAVIVNEVVRTAPPVVVTETTRTTTAPVVVSGAATTSPGVVVVQPGTQVGVGTVTTGQTTAAGADTTGVARSTGGGIGEASTRSDVGTGRGGAGIVRSGTLAPGTVRSEGGGVVTTVPSEVIPTTNGRVIVAPTIPRETTATGTLGAGTSTPVGVAPGF